MDKQAFKERMKSLKSYRELNPDKGYWDWKVLAFDGGGTVLHLLSLGGYKGKTYAEIQEEMRTNDPEAYDRLQADVAREEHPTSEIVFYKDADGNYQSARGANPGLSGKDPLAALVVENAVLNKPISYVINRLGKFVKLLGMNKTYTGIPKNKLVRGTNKTMVENFPNYEGTVWTTPNKQYARTFDGEREVFKVFGSDKNFMDTPVPENGQFFSWQILPFKLDKFTVVKGVTNTLKRAMSKVDDMGNEFVETGILEYPEYVNLSQWKEYPKKGIRTDEVVNWSKDLGYAGTKFHRIHDGTIWKNGLPVDEPIDEFVYNSGKNLIKVPENVSDWSASNFVDFSFGNKIAPTISTLHGITTKESDIQIPAYTDGTGGNDDKLYLGRTDQDYYGNLTHNIVVDADGNEVNFGLPDIVITPKNNLSLGTYNYNEEVARNVADIVSFVPGVGEVIDATVAAQDASKGDYTTAAGLGLGLFIPNVIEKPLKWMWKGGKKIMQNSLSSVADLMENHSPQGRFAVGFAKDILTQPSRTFKALREGTYPTSYTKVSLLVRKLHEELLDKKIAHWKMVTNDFDRNVRLRIDMLNGELPDASDFDILSQTKNRIHNTFFSFPEYIVGRSFRNHGGSSSLLGFHNGNKAVTKARHRTNFIDIDDIVGTSVHERLHEINKILPYYDDLTEYSPSADYYTVSGDGEHFITDVFKFQNASVVDATEKGYLHETWQSSPSEFLAELANYRVMFADGRNYSEMTPEQREKIAEKMTSRFYTPMTAYYSGKTDDELQTIMMDKLKTLDVFGYSDGGIVGKKKLKRSLKNKQKENKSN